MYTESERLRCNTFIRITLKINVILPMREAYPAVLEIVSVFPQQDYAMRIW